MILCRSDCISSVIIYISWKKSMWGGCKKKVGERCEFSYNNSWSSKVRTWNNFYEISKEAVCCAITLFYVIYHIKSSDIEYVLQSNIFLYVPASPASAKKSVALLSQRDVVKQKKSFLKAKVVDMYYNQNPSVWIKKIWICKLMQLST